jgi:hypothetical protein
MGAIPDLADYFRRQGIAVGPTKLLQPGVRGSGQGIVRNVNTQRVLPCNHADCERPGNDNINITLPHDSPKPGYPPNLRYIFCSDAHRRAFAKGTKYERYL